MIKILILVLLLAFNIDARKHNLSIKNDQRHFIPISTFGFYKGGILQVNIGNFKPGHETSTYGLSLERSQLTDQVNDFDFEEECVFTNKPKFEQNSPIIFFQMVFNSSVVELSCSKWESTRTNKEDTSLLQIYPGNPQPAHPNEPNAIDDIPCNKLKLPMTTTVTDNIVLYNFQFHVLIGVEDKEGMYNLNFHSCSNEQDPVSFELFFEENNAGNYLSATEMQLPALYFFMSLLFFGASFWWIILLCKSKYSVLKIHHMMTLLVILKSFSLIFNTIHMHYIEVTGVPNTFWAFTYYSTHFIKGLVMFITLLLLGSGWSFIKTSLEGKEKILFIILIPVQVLVCVADVMILSGDKGDTSSVWRRYYILSDLICGVALLVPVFWTMRSLKSDLATNEKAATFEKLRLFRHLFIMIICYIYLSRIGVFLLKISITTMRFAWLTQKFQEMSTFIFFVVTLYKFRPNPYFKITDSVKEETLRNSQNREKFYRRIDLPTLSEEDEDEEESLIYDKDIQNILVK